MLQIKKECTGCMACKNSCPKNAIRITRDLNGFVMPEIDAETCIDCHLCEMVCPIEKLPSRILKPEAYQAILQKQEAAGETIAQRPKRALAMYHRDPEIVRISSSGGAFYTLAQKVLEKQGIVFGSVFDVNQKEAYLTDTDHVPLEKLLTSKYVESSIGDGFRRVKAELETGREVLFCGTPCQAAGLRAYLGKEKPGLLIVDFTCGAVTAQPVLKQYLEELEQRYHAKLVSMSFRDKYYGWGQYCLTAGFANGRSYRKTAMSDPYFFCFLRSSMQRLSCHGCQFSDRHASDLVLADFWRCEQFEIDRNDRRGLSLVLALTESGERALEEILPLVHAEEVDLERASYNLKARFSPETKLEEILTDQKDAHVLGVTALRKRLLTPKQRRRFAFRQYVMDHPVLKPFFPKLEGDGQIVKRRNG